MNAVRIKLMNAGYCEAFEHHAIQGGKRKKIHFYAVFTLLEHPIQGYILFDTGYTERFYNETKKYPAKIYANITKVYINQSEEAAYQLSNMGIAPEQIKHIIVSHFHADHIGGLKDFPNATFYCSKLAYQQIKEKNGIFAIRYGLLKGLLPENFKSRLKFIENCKLIPQTAFNAVYDLFGDQLIKIVQLEGHAAGQIGALIQSDNSIVFLISDACWLSKSYRENILSHRITGVFFYSWKAYKQNLERLHAFHIANPEVIIIPTHCKETTTDLMKNLAAW